MIGALDYKRIKDGRVPSNVNFFLVIFILHADEMSKSHTSFSVIAIECILRIQFRIMSISVDEEGDND